MTARAGAMTISHESGAVYACATGIIAAPAAIAASSVIVATGECPPPCRPFAGAAGRTGSGASSHAAEYAARSIMPSGSPPASAGRGSSLPRDTPAPSCRAQGADGSGGCPVIRSGTVRAAETRSTPRECATSSTSPNTTRSAIASVETPPTTLNTTPAQSSAPRIDRTPCASNHRLKSCSASDDSSGLAGISSAAAM
ncbi:hypothetical protein [Actinomadura madurae]|uniref:hypothetical protein n=1 Tax=Actinomadura madurae TaxID=1993 RepID=UPI0020D1FFEF|nr:hypothetical protein [Actinomadura madurae]MCQ0018571.1 hypothetical protein [Actinomadura madurae]